VAEALCDVLDHVAGFSAVHAIVIAVVDPERDDQAIPKTMIPRIQKRSSAITEMHARSGRYTGNLSGPLTLVPCSFSNAECPFPAHSRPGRFTRRPKASAFATPRGQALAYVYYEDETGRRMVMGRLTKDEARRIADFTKSPAASTRRPADLGIKAHAHMLRHTCGYKLANDGRDTLADRGLPRPPQHPEHDAVYCPGIAAG
jgi:hypothetical protein